MWLFNLSHDIFGKGIRVKPENIVNVKHYTHNELSIYQTKQVLQHHVSCLPTPSLLNMQYLLVGKTTLLRQKSQQTNYYFRIATKLAKAYQYKLL